MAVCRFFFNTDLQVVLLPGSGELTKGQAYGLIKTDDIGNTGMMMINLDALPRTSQLVFNFNDKYNRHGINSCNVIIFACGGQGLMSEDEKLTS